MWSAAVAVPAWRTVLRPAAVPGPRPLRSARLVPRRARPRAARVADVRHPFGHGQRLPRLPQFCRAKKRAVNTLWWGGTSAGFHTAAPKMEGWGCGGDHDGSTKDGGENRDCIAHGASISGYRRPRCVPGRCYFILWFVQRHLTWREKWRASKRGLLKSLGLKTSGDVLGAVIGEERLAVAYRVKCERAKRIILPPPARWNMIIRQKQILWYSIVINRPRKLKIFNLQFI